MYIGLDVHKPFIDIAIAEEGRAGEVRHFGKITSDLAALDKLVRKLSAKGTSLHFVYEAGPCGYTIYRHLTQKKLFCAVIAPSKTPRKSGERVKTDRRDAISLARLERAGELTHVHVPRPEDEAMRDLVRARTDAVHAHTQARQQLAAFLLRLGIRYNSKTDWSQKHQRFIADIALPSPAQQIAFQEYVEAISETAARVERITSQIMTLLPDWRLNPLVEALQALRGVSLITAVICVAEIGDFSRFAHPRELMSYLGLVPSEHTSSGKRRVGSITKAGNAHVRWALVESAWAYHFPARVSRDLVRRQQRLPKKIREISWKAQLRLCAKYRKLCARGKLKQQVVTAIARELAAFIWAIAGEVKLPALH
jgi:transposase